MSKLHFTIETSENKVQMKARISALLANNSVVAGLLDEHRWQGDVLHAKGKLGHGTITVEDRKVVVDIELSLFGSVAKGTIESKIRKQLGS